MHREDDSKFLLYIEPSKSEKLSDPVEDELVEIVEMAIESSKTGTANYSDLDDDGSNFRERDGWRGIHVTECGKASSNSEHLLPNGMITNSLAPFYLRWYRESIPETEMRKLESLREFYNKTEK